MMQQVGAVVQRSGAVVRCSVTVRCGPVVRRGAARWSGGGTVCLLTMLQDSLPVTTKR